MEMGFGGCDVSLEGEKWLSGFHTKFNVVTYTHWAISQKNSHC